jgi:hypothetical protein
MILIRGEIKINQWSLWKRVSNTIAYNKLDVSTSNHEHLVVHYERLSMFHMLLTKDFSYPSHFLSYYWSLSTTSSLLMVIVVFQIKQRTKSNHDEIEAFNLMLIWWNDCQVISLKIIMKRNQLVYSLWILQFLKSVIFATDYGSTE